MPLDQHIEGRHGERQPGVEIRPHAVHDSLEMEHHRQHGEHRLHQQTVLPRATLTHFEVGRIALRGMEGGITQDYHLFFELPNEPLKGVLCDIGGGAIPHHDQPPLVQHQAEFAADNPAVIREPLTANLLRAAAFAHGMDQLNPIGVDDPEHGWGRQEGRGPCLVGPEEAKEPGALGEPGKGVCVADERLSKDFHNRSNDCHTP